MRVLIWAAAAAVALASGAAAAPRGLEGVPRYDHVIVVVEENKDYGQILDPRLAPNIAGLAKHYGDATRFFGEQHPSEANYVALLGGDTFGIYDDDAYYCHAGLQDRACPGSSLAGYPDHTAHAPHLGDQLAAKGLSWKGYYEDLPKPGSGEVVAGALATGGQSYPAALYAAKHSGFMNFASAQADPQRAEHIVGFDQLDRDLAADALPNFALVVPNQCNEMHGLHGPGVPADCDIANTAALIRRGDAYVGELVRRIQATAAWKGPGKVAIVITFDEGARGAQGGCCGVTPGQPSNFGSGHIPTVVITNHGPRGLRDATPYSHYSLLRTVEDAFGISEHLRHANDTAKGVRPMRKLFGG